MNHTDSARGPSFLPDFCGVRMVFVVVLIGELLAIILTLTGAREGAELVPALGVNSLFIQWLGLSSVAALCFSRRWLNRLNDDYAATASFIIILAVCLIFTELTWRVGHSESFGIVFPGRESHGMFLLRCLGISAIVSALALRYFYILAQWRRNIRSEAELRVQALQAKIRPHFLFNCMNTIASLTRTSPPLAEEAIEDLSDLFRASLMDTSRLSTLDQELELCRHYLRIEAHRLGERLQVQWNTGHLPGKARLPALILQPLIENALYHGIQPLPSGGAIAVSGRHEGGRVTICVSNPIPPPGGNHARDGNQLAQENIRQRLAACFGPEGKLETRVVDNHYYAEITFPDHVADSYRG